jgi:hypothetical protein
MTKAKKLEQTTTTPKGRASYVTIFQPKRNTLNNQDEYSLQLLFEKGADLTKVFQIVENAAINKWGPKANWPKGNDGKGLKFPFKSQKYLIEAAKKKERPHDHLHPEAIFITPKRSALDKTGKPNPHPVVLAKDAKTRIEESSLFYSGCYCRAEVYAHAYDKGGNVGVTLYLNGVQFMGDGPQLGGNSRIEEAFEAIPEDDLNIAAGQDAGSVFSSMIS